MRRLAPALLLVLSACGFGAGAPTVIDGSNAEAFKRTVADARAELGPRDRLKFEAALTAARGKQFAAESDSVGTASSGMRRICVPSSMPTVHRTKVLELLAQPNTSPTCGATPALG